MNEQFKSIHSLSMDLTKRLIDTFNTEQIEEIIRHAQMVILEHEAEETLANMDETEEDNLPF